MVIRRPHTIARLYVQQTLLALQGAEEALRLVFSAMCSCNGGNGLPHWNNASAPDGMGLLWSSVKTREMGGSEKPQHSRKSGVRRMHLACELMCGRVRKCTRVPVHVMSTGVCSVGGGVCFPACGRYQH